MHRWIPAVLALLLGANALFMLVAPQAWYDAVPGVSLTGLYNPHFVRDIAMAYLVAVLGLAWFAWRPVQGWPAVVCAAAFLSLHAAIHLFDNACGGSPLRDGLRDLPGVYLPAVLTSWMAFAARPPRLGA
jgi:hypothetical protein